MNREADSYTEYVTKTEDILEKIETKTALDGN